MGDKLVYGEIVYHSVPLYPGDSSLNMRVRLLSLYHGCIKSRAHLIDIDCRGRAM